MFNFVACLGIGLVGYSLSLFAPLSAYGIGILSGTVMCIVCGRKSS